MKTVPPKFRFILIAVVIKLAGSIACAQTLPAPDQYNDIINNSQAARRRLRQADILSIGALQKYDSNQLQNDNAAKVQLQQVIEHIQALKTPKQKPLTAADIQPVQPAQHTGTTQQQTSALSKPDKRQTPKAPATDDTQRALAALINNPQNVLDPLAVAEALFQQGNLKDAAKFYKLALERMADKTENPNRPWAMFQAANCIRHDDPTGAYQLYQQLINEYPASDWTAAAHSHLQVITWYRQNKPKKILERYIGDPNSL